MKQKRKQTLKGLLGEVGSGLVWADTKDGAGTAQKQGTTLG